ncbi:MAG: hypothetical protein HRF43_20015 [Phycisphaerae bacterium]|jgi:hypothetical protein
MKYHDSITKAIVFFACVALTTSFALAAPKDITSQRNPFPDGTPNPNGSLNVEARYLVHVGFTAVTAGLTSAVNVNSRGLLEYHSSGGNSGNWGRLNNSIVAIGTAGGQENFTPNTFGGPNPDYAGYLFNLPATVTAIKFWNRTNTDGGTFAATPEVQYLDAPDPIGTWHTISGVTWSPAYNPDYLPGNEVRLYNITLNEPISGAWGIRLIGDGNPNGGVATDPTGWVGFQELVIIGELDIGDIDLSKNKALSSLPSSPIAIATREQGANEMVRLNDGNITTRSQTWGDFPEYAEDYMGIAWGTPQYGVSAMGIAFHSFGDGGLFDDCQVPLRIEYTTSTNPDWTPVTNLNKHRYPYVWQRISYLANVQVGFLFTFDPVNDVTAIRIIGDPHGDAGADESGFLGAYEVEVFGVPVLAEVIDSDDDGDIDEIDVAAFTTCASGDQVPYVVPDCADRDLDGDGDVDQKDFALVQLCYTGGGTHWDPNCGN